MLNSGTGQASEEDNSRGGGGGGGGRYAAAPGRVWEGSTAQLGGREESCKLPH